MSATTARRPAGPLGLRGWVRDPLGRFSWLKAATLALVLLPALVLAARTVAGDLGPDAFKEATHVTGRWAVRILLVSLMVTPARAVLDSTRVLMLRRLLGVASACYIVAHFALYVAFQDGDLLHVASEIASRFYLTVGFVAFLGLVALALTSTNGWQRRLGRNWKRLHKFAYLFAALGLLHYFYQSKLDVTNAALAAGVFVWLMLWRLEPRRWQPLRWPLPELAVLAALVTAVMEAGWYFARNGISPLRVLAANLDVAYGPTAAGYVLLLGLLVAAIAVARPLWRKKPDPARRAARGARLDAAD